MGKLLKYLALLAICVAQAAAVPITWVLSGVTFSDGGTATGSFAYDADTNVYSFVNVTTTNGSARTGATYHFVCGQDVPTCIGVNPATSAIYLNLTSNAANQTGLPAFSMIFTPALSNTVGVRTISFGLEGNCSNAACANATPPTRLVSVGTVTAQQPQPTPIPTTWILATTGIMLAGLYSWWIRRRASATSF